MNYISLIGGGLFLIGMVLLTLNTTGYANINYIFIILSLVIGMIITYIGGQQ